MSLSLYTLQNGMSLVGHGEDLGDRIKIEMPFTLNQAPSQDINGISEFVFMLPFVYKFTGQTSVTIMKNQFLIEPVDVNETFKQFYELSVAKQIKHDDKQAFVVNELYNEYMEERSKTLH